MMLPVYRETLLQYGGNIMDLSFITISNVLNADNEEGR